MAASKIRKQQSLCSLLMVFVQTNYFKDTEEALFAKRGSTASLSYLSTLELVDFAVSGLKKIYEKTVITREPA